MRRDMRPACALLMLASAFACSTPSLAKDDLVIGVAQFPSSLHPDIDPEVIKAYVVDFANRTTTAFDPDWKNSCLLCTELPTLDNGLARMEDRPDGGHGMAVTIKLKPDLAWGDGVPVSARDIAFTWKVGRDPNSGFSNPHSWDRASAVDVVDDHTAILHLDKPLVSYNQWDNLLPEHIEGPIYDRAGGAGDYVKLTAYNSAPTTAGLWNGPYVVAQYQSGTQIVLEPNPHWAGHKPGFSRIVVRLVENTAALQANLLSGDVDMVAGEGVGLTIDQAIALRKKQPDRFDYIFKPSLTYEHIDLQKDNPLLADVRVRRALLQALDRDTLVARLFEGLQPVATTWVNPLDPNYASGLPSYGYDPASAKALLAQAGWTPGSDGICRNDAGARLSLEFTTTAGNRLRELIQQVLQNQWKASCVEARIRNEPARTMFGETAKHRKYEAMLMYAWVSDVTASPRTTLGTDRIPTEVNNWGGSNFLAFSDPRMDAGIATAETELDLQKRKAAWADMQRLYAEQVPALPLFFRAEPHIVPKWLKGYRPTGHADYSSDWAEDWHAE